MAYANAIRFAGVSQAGGAGRRGRPPKSSLVRHIERAPWILNEFAWASILDASRAESLRNRLMVAMAYDGALRREELVQVEIDDLDLANATLDVLLTCGSPRLQDVREAQAVALSILVLEIPAPRLFAYRLG
jgi:integrase